MLLLAALKDFVLLLISKFSLYNGNYYCDLTYTNAQNPKPCFAHIFQNFTGLSHDITRKLHKSDETEDVEMSLVLATGIHWLLVQTS